MLVEGGITYGFRSQGEQHSISRLQFADDTIFFVGATNKNIRALKNQLISFWD